MPAAAASDTNTGFEVRPTRKPAWLALAVAAAIISTTYWAYFRFGAEWPGWVPLLSLPTLIPALLGWIDSLRCSLRLAGGELRLQSGLLSKTTRSLDLTLVRDARAERRLAQRLWNVGTLVVEGDTAAARLEIRDIDAPARIAKQILSAAGAARSARKDNP